MRMFSIVAVLLMCAGAAQADVKHNDQCDYNTKQIVWDCVKTPQTQVKPVVKCAVWADAKTCSKWVKIWPQQRQVTVDREIINKKLMLADPLMRKQMTIKKIQ